MSLSLLLACLWVVCSAIVAMLPMRQQYVPGLTLLIVAPFLLGFVAYQHGAWIFALGLAACVSMFRHPLVYIYRRLRGQTPEIRK